MMHHVPRVWCDASCAEGLVQHNDLSVLNLDGHLDGLLKLIFPPSCSVSFTVLQGPSLHGGGIGSDDSGIDFILGLDNLMRHQCSIDLKVFSSPCPAP